jgi:hypothetical protein
MDRQDVCILINSTPKYFYLLPLQMTLIRRYAPTLHWPVYFATEVPNDPISKQLETEFQVKILPLPEEKSGFLESREEAIRLLPSEILYVLPLQEDFLLDRTPDYKSLLDALFILDTDRHVSSLRLMPCPGPNSLDLPYVKEKPWKILGEKDIYYFTYQATMWRRMDIHTYYSSLLASIQKNFGDKSESEKKYVALTTNIGENHFGQKLIRDCLKDTLHLCWPRAHNSPNAVYLSPWPYRPTAVTRGRLETWAAELFLREGVKFERPTANTMG